MARPSPLSYFSGVVEFPYNPECERPVVRKDLAPTAAKLVLGMVSILAIGIENGSTSEPWGLKSDRLGMGLQDFKASHRREAAPGQFAPMCSDTSPSGAGVKIEGPALGRVNCMLDFPFERMRRPWEKGYIPPPTIAEVRMLSHAYRFLDGKLWRIEAFVATSDFPALRAAAEAKYGSPARVGTEQLQNKLVRGRLLGSCPLLGGRRPSFGATSDISKHGYFRLVHLQEGS